MAHELKRAFVLGLLASAALLAAPKESVKAVVQRTARWVEQSERDFTSVIADETYDQFVTRGLAPHQDHRTIQSELLFIRGDGPDWVAVRNVLAYTDAGEPTVRVENSRDRLTRELAAPRTGTRSVIRRLADESARFNIGRISRNFNTPTLALQFLDDSHRGRFKFTLEDAEAVAAVDTWRLYYQERQHPTLIQADYRDTELSGKIWSRASDGAVLKTSLSLAYRNKHEGLQATIAVDYADDRKLGRLVPVHMEEEYDERSADSGHIRGVAVYTNYRIFETSARVISPP